MAFDHTTLTLTGAAQQIINPAGVAGAALNIPLREINFQADGANAAAVFIGDSTVSTTDYGFRIPVPATNVPAPPLKVGPYSNSGPIKPADFWVVGAANEKLHISWVPF